MAEVFVEVWNSANSSKIGDLSTDGSNHHGVLGGTLSSRRMGAMQATVQVRRDHPRYIAGDLVRGNHLRWKIDGVHSHTTRILTIDDTRVSPNGSAGQIVEVFSESHIQILKEGKVRPYGGEAFRPTSQSRSFGPHAPETDTTSWPNAVLQYEGVASPIAGVPGFEPWEPPDGCPEPIDDVDWIAPTAAPASTAGIFVHRGGFTNPTQQDLWIAFSSDDGCRPHMDGYELFGWTVRYPAEGSFRSLWRCIVRDVSAGYHTLSADLEVLPGNPSGPRRGMLLGMVHALPAAGTPLSASTFISGTSTAWKCRTTPGDMPACNPHEAFDAVLDDAQAIDMCDGVTLSSSSSLDSNGDAWTTEVPAALQVWNQSLFDVLDSWRAAGVCEFEMDKASQQVHLYNPDGLGVVSDAVFTDGVDIAEDTDTVDGDIVNTLGILTAEGWELAQDSTSVTAHGAVGASLNLADAVSESARDDAVNAFFDLEADPKESRVLVLRPKAVDDLPGAWDAGDWVTVNGDEVRVEMWATRWAGNQLAEFQVELKTSLQVAAERDQLRLDQVAGGSAGGRSSVATLWQDSEDLPSGKLERRDFPVYSPDNDEDTHAPVVGTSKSVRSSNGAVRVTTLEVKGIWTEAGDMPYADGVGPPRITRTNYVVQMLRDGSPIATLTLTPDDVEKVELVSDGLFIESNYYSIYATGGVGLNDVLIRSTATEAI